MLTVYEQLILASRVPTLGDFWSRPHR